MSELTYTTSQDYERLADLMEAGWGVTNGAGTTFSCIRYDREDGSQSRTYWIDYGEEADHQKTREEFIAECQHRFIEFLDPELPAQQAARIEELETALDEALAYLALEGDYYEEPIARLKAVMKGGKS